MIFHNSLIPLDKDLNEEQEKRLRITREDIGCCRYTENHGTTACSSMPIWESVYDQKRANVNNDSRLATGDESNLMRYIKYLQSSREHRN